MSQVEKAATVPLVWDLVVKDIPSTISIYNCCLCSMAITSSAVYAEVGTQVDCKIKWHVPAPDRNTSLPYSEHVSAEA